MFIEFRDGGPLDGCQKEFKELSTEYYVAVKEKVNITEEQIDKCPEFRKHVYLLKNIAGYIYYEYKGIE